MSAGGAPGLPPLSLSTGPAISGNSGPDGWSATGAFNFKRDDGILATVERLAPFAAIGALAWFLAR